MIEIVSATRMSQDEFLNKSALGLSLQRIGQEKRIAACVAFANGRGLPKIYNSRITAGDNVEALVFMHDDVWIDDYFLVDRVLEGLKTYDVIGVVGNRRSVKGQAGWAAVDAKSASEEAKNLSGAIAHGKDPFGPVSFFGPTPADVEFIDGVFIAARKSVLNEKGVFFDTRFDFHFYDVDFCRTARQHGLRIGTWPICLTHQSGGAYGTPQWTENYKVYKDKWER